jgi:hypothetical protein
VRQYFLAPDQDSAHKMGVLFGIEEDACFV